MSLLYIYDEKGQRLGFTDRHPEIADRLRDIDVTFERWEANRPLQPAATQQEVLDAYASPIRRLNDTYGFSTVDVVALTPDHPQREVMRGKFLDEHTHDDFEVRFFVAGRGLFYLHADGGVLAVLCEQGDLISVPAGTRHWFDMGSEPDFKCIRFFTTEEGWVGNFTGSDIARSFPTFDDLMREAA